MLPSEELSLHQTSGKDRRLQLPSQRLLMMSPSGPNVVETLSIS
jgi:hypothetical protein